MQIKQAIITMLEALHRKLFGSEMSEVMRGFLGNLSFSLFLGLLTAVILFIVNILAGRILGPAEYGEYNYIYSLAITLTFFILLGNNTSAIRFIAESKYHSRRGAIMTAATVLTLFQVFVIGVLTYWFWDLIAQKFSISNRIIILTFLFGFILSLRDLFDSFIRAFGYFKKQAAFKFIEALVIVIVFLFFYFFYFENFHYYFYAVAFLGGATVFIILATRLFWQQATFFQWQDIALLFHYNKFLILAGFGGMLLGLEKVFIGKYLGNEQLGIYSAYYTASQTTLSALAIIFIGVFWPMVIQNKKNLGVIIQKLDTVFYKYFMLWLLLNAVMVSLIMTLFGAAYPIRFMLILLFATSSILNIFFFIYVSILNIDYIKRAGIISIIVYGTIVSSIIVLKDITFYICFQIIIYIFALGYVRAILGRYIPKDFKL